MRLGRTSDVPVAVGFGISTPDQAASVAELADGFIGGSAIVRRQADPALLGAFVAGLAAAVHGAGGTTGRPVSPL